MQKKTAVKTSTETVYEVGYHIVPTVSPEQLPKEVEAIKALLGGKDAKIISEEAPKLRPLAYTMLKVVGPLRQKFDTAYFGWIKFEGTSDAIVAIQKALDESEKVLRSLVVKTVAENTLYGAKVLPKEAPVAEKGEGKVEVSAEEVDKVVEKLIVE